MPIFLVFLTFVYHEARFRECERFFVSHRSCGSFHEDTNYSHKINVPTHTYIYRGSSLSVVNLGPAKLHIMQAPFYYRISTHKK